MKGNSTIRIGAMVLFICVAIGAPSRLSGQWFPQSHPPGIFPPGTYRIDGIPVTCAGVTTVEAPKLRDVGSNDLQGHIYVNPDILRTQPTVLKLFWYAHECGHSVVGENETAADCWAIKTGKRQGWFPPSAFQALEAAFANNPGDWTHLPGPQRVSAIENCYGYHKNGTGADSATADDNAAAIKKKSKSSEDTAVCDQRFNTCMEGVREVAECVRSRQRVCMDDCTSRGYSYSACKIQLCNPDVGSNGRWEDHCSKRRDDDSDACKKERRDCRELHSK